MEVHRPVYTSAALRLGGCAGIPSGRSYMAPLVDALCITGSEPRVVVRGYGEMPVSPTSPTPHPQLGQWLLGTVIRRPDDGFWEFVAERTQGDIIPTTVLRGPRGRSMLKLVDNIVVMKNPQPAHGFGFFAVMETFGKVVVMDLPHQWNPAVRIFSERVFWTPEVGFYLDGRRSNEEKYKKMIISKFYARVGLPPIMFKWEKWRKKGLLKASPRSYLERVLRSIRRRKDGMTMARAQIWDASKNTVTVHSSRININKEEKEDGFVNQSTGKISKSHLPSGLAIKEKMASTKAHMMKGLVCAKMNADGRSPVYIVYAAETSVFLVSKNLDSESAADLSAQPLALGEFVKISVKHEKVSSSNIMLDYIVESFTRMAPPSDFSATVSDKGNFALLKMPLVLSNGKLLSLCRTIVTPVSEEVCKNMVNGETYTATVHFQYDAKSQGITPVVSPILCEENSVGSKNVNCLQSQSEVFALGEERCKSVSPTLGGTGTSSEATCSHGSDDKDKATTRKKNKKIFPVENPYQARILVGAAMVTHDNLDRFVDVHRPHGLPPFGFCGTYSDDEYSSEGMEEEESAPPNMDDSMDMEIEVEQPETRDARNQEGGSWKMDQRDVSPDMDRMQSDVEPVLQREERNQQSWDRDERDFFPNTHHAENRPQRVDVQRKSSARNRVSWEIDQIDDRVQPDQTYARQEVSRDMKEQSLRRRPMQTHPQPRVQREVRREAGGSSEPERFRHPHLTDSERFTLDPYDVRLANNRPPSRPSTSNAWTEPTARTQPVTASRIVSRLASNPALMQAIYRRQPAQYDRIRSFGGRSNNKRRSGFY